MVSLKTSFLQCIYSTFLSTSPPGKCLTCWKWKSKVLIPFSELLIKYCCLIYSNYCTLHNGTWFQSQHQYEIFFNPIPIYIYLRSLRWLLKRWQTTITTRQYYNTGVLIIIRILQTKWFVYSQSDLVTVW